MSSVAGPLHSLVPRWARFLLSPPFLLFISRHQTAPNSIPEPWNQTVPVTSVSRVSLARSQACASTFLLWSFEAQPTTRQGHVSICSLAGSQPAHYILLLCYYIPVPFRTTLGESVTNPHPLLKGGFYPWPWFDRLACLTGVVLSPKPIRGSGRCLLTRILARGSNTGSP
jgi:hypothetical protein